MPAEPPSLWGAARPYERYMGRWSRLVAPLFAAWVEAPPRSRWINIGCGTSVLTSAVLAVCRLSVRAGHAPQW